MSTTPQPAVAFEFISDDRPAVRSVELAEHFGMKHGHVLRDIKALMAKLPESFNGSNFGPVTYRDEKGEQRPCFLLTRDAFTLLVMGWSSPRAIEWKLKYIEAFNALERAALENARQEAIMTGARAWLALPAPTREWLPRAMDYHKRGLNTEEIGKLLDISGSSVAKALQQARAIGMLPEKQPAKRRRRPNGQGRNQRQSGAGA